MTVASAGTGTFTATGLTTPGTATITVTNIASAAFSNAISSGNVSNTITVIQSPTTATVGSTQNICGSLTTASLGGNTPSVGTGQWSQTGGPGTTTFSDATSGSATATASIPGTYVYTWTITNVTCTSAASVTVNYYATPTTATIATTPLSYCGTLTSGSLGGNTPSVGTGQWSQTSGPGTTTFSAGTSGSSTATASVAGTYVYTWTISNGTCTPSTASVTVNFNPLPTITTAGTATAVCFNAGDQATSLAYSATTNSPTSYSITWNASPANSFATVTDAALPASPITITVPGNTAAGTYTGTITVKNANGCVSSGTVFTVTVNSAPAITGQPSNQTVCTGGTVSFTVTATGAGLTYQWFNGATQLNNGGNISGATTATLTINPAGAGDASSNYYCVVSGTCTPSPATSNNASLTVNNITYGGNTSSGTTFTPCINMPSNPQTVSTTIDADQYFVMNVIQGLTYQVYTNALPAAGNALRLTVYEEGNPAGPVLASSVSNTGNPVSGNANDVFVSFTSTFSGQVRVLINNRTDCGSTSPLNITTLANVSGGSNTLDNQATAGANTWIGHIYDGTNAAILFNGSFTGYLGDYTQTETFNETFGAGGSDNLCFSPVTSNGTARATVTDVTFSVRYRMNSTTRKGLYVADIGSDDGSRLAVDGTLVYNNFIDQGYVVKPRVLMNLTGSSNLLLDYYENGGGNQISFQTLTLVLANNLTTNTTQNVCLGSTGTAISGDVYGTLPTGITLSGTGYQWTYSTTPGGTQTNAPGTSTTATYTPNTTVAPFNVPGTYYLYRNAKLLSAANNTGVANYVATNVSNAATLTVNALPAIPTGATGASECGTGSVTISVADPGAGFTIDWYAAASGGTVLTGGTGTTSFTTPSISTTTNYFAQTRNTATGCVSATRTQVTATVVPAPTAVAGTAVSTCSNTGAVNITSGSGATNNAGVTWTSSGTGTFANPNSLTTCTYTPSAADITAGSVTLTLTASPNSPCVANATSTKTLTINAAPTAVAGTAVTTCSTSGAVNITAGSSATNQASVTWTSNGTGTFTNPNSLTLATYTPSAADIAAGSRILTLTAVGNAGCANATSTKNITIIAAPTVSLSSSSICIGSTTTVLPSTGGTWVSSNPSIASVTNAGVVTPGSTAGSATFTFTSSATGCSNTTSALTVDATCQVVTLTQPAQLTATISGVATTICIGQSVPVTVSVIGGTAPYVINGVQQTGSGPFTITESPTSTTTYDNTNIIVTDAHSCTSATSGSVAITVNPNASVTSVTGATPLCIGATATYTANGEVLGGGAELWSSDNTLVATVDPATGEVTAVGAGTANIIYTITGGCNGTPFSSTVSNGSSKCSNSFRNRNQPAMYRATATYTANGEVLGGGAELWSSDNTLVATVDPATGEVTAVGAGTANIICTITGGCNGTPSAQQLVTVLPNAAITSVTGTSPLCIGATATYTANGEVLGGGAELWSSDNTLVATVDPATGEVTAVGAGTANIICTITGGCNGTPSSQQLVTVLPNAAIASVTGTSPLCIGATATYTANGEVLGGGAELWSSDNTLVATVDPATGEVTAVGAGTANIIYTITGGCNGTPFISTVSNGSSKCSNNFCNRRNQPALYRSNSNLYCKRGSVRWWRGIMEQR